MAKIQTHHSFYRGSVLKVALVPKCSCNIDCRYESVTSEPGSSFIRAASIKEVEGKQTGCRRMIVVWNKRMVVPECLTTSPVVKHDTYAMAMHATHGACQHYKESLGHRERRLGKPKKNTIRREESDTICSRKGNRSRTAKAVHLEGVQSRHGGPSCIQTAGINTDNMLVVEADPPTM